MDDGQQPGAHAADACVVATGRPPDRQERVLAAVLGPGAVPADAPGQRVRSADVTVVDDLERVGVRIGDERHQLLVGHAQQVVS
jgi:hypothetical protein